MSDGDGMTLVALLAWVAWSLAHLSARSKRTADALERLVTLAERGRR